MVTLTADRRVLHADLAGETIRAASGSMVAYTGTVDFKHAGMGGGGGFKAALKQKVSGESIKLMECTGSGRVTFAQDALDVTVIDLANDTLAVESELVLAVTAGLTLDVKFAGLQGMTSGQGLATTTLSGTGQVAVMSDGPLIALAVQPGGPLVVDPDAFVASTGNLTMNLVSGVSWKSLVGEGSGEPFSLRFEGSGTVFIQPAER
ncbi:AIM24 family protein [Nocardioides caeni]|uniref:AIM24 family protein n=1 Tax=Nocardioides caeni TaxID=574700 RepID=A0A4S8MZA0_9ACTN|nr:AIM24 family protein [Nocardioides caeni]THV08800.1 AIM24 family protein [Nocardioides caeni]